MAITKDIKTAKSVQEIWNLGFDTEYNLPVVETLTQNPVTNGIERQTAIQGNGSLVLGYDGTGNLISIQKTVGSTTYTKTLTYTDDNLTGVSVWS